MDGKMSKNTPRILLMCEDQSQASIRREQLSRVEWNVIEADDHIDAFSAVKANRADLALLHLPVDDMNSMDLSSVLRQVCPSSYLPVVILVSSPAEEQRCRFLDNGADDVICNSVSARELIARLRSLLRIKKLHDQLADSGLALEESLQRERKLLCKLQQDNEYLQDLATTDPLTRVQNVRSFQDILQHEFKIARRYNQPLSLLTLDVDHFKIINDTYGHPSGDYILKELAVIFQQSVRESDVVARTGGEEFAVVLPKADPQQAMTFAERIRDEVYKRKFIVFGNDIHVTISIGLATHPADAEITDPNMLVYFADQMLLRAKETGRDRVVTVTSLPMKIRRLLKRQYNSTPETVEA